MKLHLDLKSATIGLVAGMLITLTIGASKTPPGAIGRFQIAGTHSHALVIDTTTGQVWRGFFPPGSGNTDGDFLKPKTEAQ